MLLIDPGHERFDDFVVQPARELRRLVRTQLNAIDPHTYSAKLQIVLPSERDILGQLRNYDLLEEIAEGGMARVYKALDRETQTVVALKKVTTSAEQVNEAAIQGEIDIYRRLQRISSRHVLTVLDAFREENTYALVTEYAEGGSLWDVIVKGGGVDDAQPLDPSTAQTIALQIVDGLVILHENQIVHRDIKPQNILRCDDTWKIADFGISKFTRRPVTGHTFQGAHSRPWAPPEQIQGTQAHPSADIYALGRVMLFMLTGKANIGPDSGASEEWLEIIRKCIEIDPAHRPDVSKVWNELKALVV